MCVEMHRMLDQADDVTTAMLLNPVVEIAQLRSRQLAEERNIKLGGGVAHKVGSASGTHLDVEVTFRGLSALSTASRAAFQPTVTVFAGDDNSSGHAISWQCDQDTSALKLDSGSGGWVNGTTGGGPLALRASKDSLSVRVLVDASVVEAFWDGGRARYTAHTSGNPQGNAGVMVGAGAIDNGVVSADIDVYEMSSMWLS
jgi:hypothetical protein